MRKEGEVQGSFIRLRRGKSIMMEWGSKVTSRASSFQGAPFL